jgi:flagellin
MPRFSVWLQAQRRLDSAGSKLRNSFNRLSSGYRINSGRDDSAGLAIAETLKADSRIAQQAIRNTNDGISTSAIADGALGEVASILSRLSELASQAAMGTLSTQQRSVVSNEFRALGSEIQRISEVTEFNGIKLLSGSSSVTIQVGAGTKVGAQI